MLRQSLRLPKKFPNRKIMSIDIGGTLAKTAFYIPAAYQEELEKSGKLESLTKDTIPSKFIFSIRWSDPAFIILVNLILAFYLILTHFSISTPFFVKILIIFTFIVDLENGDKIYLKSFHSNNVREFI